MPEGPWHTLVVVSMLPPIQSAMLTATRWASTGESLKPYTIGYLASVRIRAARSMPCSTVAGFPSIVQLGRSSI
jgi:hypothetical protein